MHRNCKCLWNISARDADHGSQAGGVCLYVPIMKYVGFPCNTPPRASRQTHKQNVNTDVCKPNLSPRPNLVLYEIVRLTRRTNNFDQRSIAPINPNSWQTTNCCRKKLLENPCKLRFITSCCKQTTETKARPAIVDMPNLHVVPGSTVSSTSYRPKWPANPPACQPASLPPSDCWTQDAPHRSLKEALYSYLKQVPTLHVNEANNLIKVLSRWIHNSKTLQIHK